jgi:hypothetical protein
MDHMYGVRYFRYGVVTVILLIGGCKSQPSSSVSAIPPKPAPVAVAHDPTPPESASVQSAPLPDALAQKTTEYAKSLEPAAEPQQAPAPAPSPVKWTQAKAAQRSGSNAPVALPLIPAAGSASPDPTVLPAAAADSAQLAAVVHSAKSNAFNDIPAIVPESSDFPKPRVEPDTLENKLARQARDNPRDVAAQLDYQLYGLLKDEPSPQLASISQLPTEDREVVSALVDGISNFRATVREDNNMLLSKKIRPILDMADRVRTEAELSVPVVALCTRVDGYGKYDPIDPARFPAGQPNPVIVYCEIANFASQPNDQQMWETKLRQGVTLYTETGLPVWHDKSRDVTDECRNRRHDFFMYDLVKLPAQLSVGRYILKITIEDLNANRVREATVPVEMVAQ